MAVPESETATAELAPTSITKLNSHVDVEFMFAEGNALCVKNIATATLQEEKPMPSSREIRVADSTVFGVGHHES